MRIWRGKEVKEAKRGRNPISRSIPGGRTTAIEMREQVSTWIMLRICAY